MRSIIDEIEAVRADPEFTKLVGATTKEEQATVFQLAKACYRAKGVIVEHGCWLGSLTLNLVRGLNLNPAAAGIGKIYAYDLFRWDPYMVDWAAGIEGAEAQPCGEDFRPLFWKQLEREPEAHTWVKAFAADLTNDDWVGLPVEIYVNDAWKTEMIARQVIRTLFPSIIPEIGLIAHQDYLWAGDSFIQVMTYRMRHKLDLFLQVPGSSMVVFRLKESISTEEAAEFSAPVRQEEIDPAFDWSSSIVSAGTRLWVELGRVWLLAQHGCLSQAAAVLEREPGCIGRYHSMYTFMKQYLHNCGGDMTALLNAQDWPFDHQEDVNAITNQIGEVYHWLPDLGVIWTNPDTYPDFHAFELNRLIRFIRRSQDFVEFDDNGNIIRVAVAP